MALVPRKRADQPATTAGMPWRSEPGLVPLSEAINRLFQGSFLAPSLFENLAGVGGVAGSNLYETGDSYVVQIAMPGIKPDSIQATVEQGVLTVHGQSALQAPEGARALWESFGGETEYRVEVPAEVESGQAEATYEAGVLTIRLPKAAPARTHTIKVTTK